MTLIVVDDQRDAADTLAELLRLDGYQVRVAYSGEEAIRLYQEKQPLGVILDVDMPQMSGYDLALWLREEAGEELVLVALTGLGDQSELVMKTLPMMDDYLRKPLDPAQLRKIFPYRPN